jgi:hypothetical protein
VAVNGFLAARLAVLDHWSDLFHRRLGSFHADAKMLGPILQLMIFVRVNAITVPILALSSGIAIACQKVFRTPSMANNIKWRANSREKCRQSKAWTVLQVREKHTMPAFDRLLEHLRSLPAGPIDDEPVMDMLAEAWDEIPGSNESAMASHKLIPACGRI